MDGAEKSTGGRSSSRYQTINRCERDAGRGKDGREGRGFGRGGRDARGRGSGKEYTKERNALTVKKELFSQLPQEVKKLL